MDGSVIGGGGATLITGADVISEVDLVVAVVNGWANGGGWYVS